MTTEPPNDPGLLRARAEAAGGECRRLGPSHEVIRKPGRGALIVTFETAERMEDAGAGVVPVAQRIAEDTGAGWICVISNGQTWFRDAAVFEFFDELTDEGVFDDADAVLFMGAGSGGYAAAAFCVASPGATVLALRPQATLSADTAGWDARYQRHRALSFEGRYGYAPDMIDAAGAVTVLYDPEEEEDAMHAALFRRDGVLRLRCPGLGHDIDEHLGSMEVLEPMVRAALEEGIEAGAFWRLFRARRSHFPYLQSLTNRLRDHGRLSLAARVCRHGLDATGRPFFRKRLTTLEERMEPPAAAE